MNKKPKPHSPDEALKRAMRLCVLQERCHQEMRDRLRDWGVGTRQRESIISTLIEYGFLNEERFAKAFARGKFRMKSWGRNKIVAEMKKRKISPQCIESGLLEISEEDYIETLKHLIGKKIKRNGPIAPSDKMTLIRRTYRYLLQKGYEPSLVSQYLQEMQE